MVTSMKVDTVMNKKKWLAAFYGLWGCISSSFSEIKWFVRYE